MQIRRDTDEVSEKNDVVSIVNIAFKGIGLAMGVAVAVLSFLDKMSTQSAIGMLGIGLACVAMASLKDREN